MDANKLMQELCAPMDGDAILDSLAQMPMRRYKRVVKAAAGDNAALAVKLQCDVYAMFVAVLGNPYLLLVD